MAIDFDNLAGQEEPEEGVSFEGLPGQDEAPELQGKIPSLYGPAIGIDIDRYKPFTSGKIETLKPTIIDIDRKRVSNAYIDAATLSALTGEDVEPKVAYKMVDALNAKHKETEDSWGQVLTKSSLAVGPSLLKGASGLVREAEEALQPEIVSEREAEKLGLEDRPKGYAGPTPIKTSFGEEAGNFWEKKIRAVDVNAGSNEVKRYAGLITTNVIQNLPFLGVGVLARSSTIPLMAMGLVTKGNKYQDLRERGLDENTARLMSTVVGVSEAATEKLGFDSLIKSGLPFAKRLLLTSALDVPGELINTSVEAAADKVSIEPGMTYEQYVKAMIDTAIVSLGSAGALTTVSHPLVAMRDAQDKKEGVLSGGPTEVVDTAEVDAEFNEAFNLPEMSPEVEQIYTEAREAAIDQGASEENATDIALEALEATEEGQAYLEDAAKGVVKPEPSIEDVFTRITQEDLTEAELDEVLEGVAGGREAFEEQVVSAPVAEIKQRLLDTGMDEIEASSNAALFDGFRVLADRAGLTTEEVVERFLPQITKEKAEVAEVTDAERTAIGDNAFLSERFITEEQLSNPDLLANAREELTTILADQKEEQTFSDEEIQQVNEAIGFIDRRAGAIKEQPAQDSIPGNGEPRGRIRFAPTGINIELLKDADQSTFVHETGHLYFRVMRDLSSLESATPQLKADFEAITGWLGVTEEQNGEITREQEEQFARGFEAFLMEGKAPTPALRQAFENFKQWLSEVYQSLLDLDVTLSDDIRGVMDRMLADEGVEVAGREGVLPEATDRDGVTYEQGRIQTETEAFEEWFGDSKVVNEKGEPDVVYHGTNQAIQQFNVERRGASTQTISAKGGFFFTDNTEEAGQYADLAASKVILNVAEHEAKTEDLMKRMEAAEKRRDWDSYESITIELEAHEIDATRQGERGANIVPSYLSMQNPMVVDIDGMANAGQISQTMDDAKAAGHDGVMLKGIDDSPKGGITSNHYIAFEPNQIKSIFNKGAFSLKSEEILEQAASPELIDQRKKDLTSTQKGDIYNIEETKRRVDNELYIHDRLPEEISSSELTGRIKDAHAIARASLEAVSENDAGPINVNRDVSGRRSEFASIRDAEAKDLKTWAEQNNLVNKNVEDVANAKKGTLPGGEENIVFFSNKNGAWLKANKLTTAPTYNELFNRVALHNNQFPDAAYKFQGFATVKGEFMPLFSQDHFASDPSISDIKKVEMAGDHLEALGYEKNPANDRQWLKGDIVVQDILPKNIAVSEGNVFIFDPVIYLNPASKSDRVIGESIAPEAEDIGEDVDLGGIEGVEVFDQPARINNIRQLTKRLGGINFNREHLKGELNKLQEDAPGMKFLINKKDSGVTLDDLLTSAIDEGILDQDATLNDVLSALEVNLETPSAIEDRLFEEEMKEREAEGKVIAKEEKEKLKQVRARLKEAVVTPRKVPVKTQVRKATGQVKPSELKQLRDEYVAVARASREAFKAGKNLGAVKEAQKLKRILARARKIKDVRNYFGLTDAELKSISRKNPLLLSQWEFKQYLDGVRIKAAYLEEKSATKAQLMHTIYTKDLGRVDNYRRALELPTIAKMTTRQLEKFTEALEPFHDGDVFLSERELQTVDRTDLAGIRTWREAKERLAKEIGVPVEELDTISVKEWDEYKWDTALMEANPFYRMLVTETTRKLMEAEISFHDIETEVFRLAKASEKSRNRTFVEKAIPQDRQIMAYIETPIDERGEIAATMTPEQLDFAHYIESYFQIALDYLIKTKSLERGRQNYFVHMRKSFLENVKDNGLIRGFKDIFKSYQEDEATFNIMDEDTGNILPLEKFFQFTLRRTGGLDPTTNVTKSFLTYAQMMEKKIALDELIPKVDIYAQSLTPQTYTPRGLEIDRSLKKFVNKYINNKKGRRIRWVAKQGGTIDVATRGLKTFTTVVDLGLNIPTGIAAFVGEQVANFQMLGTRGYTKGTARIKTAKGKRILDKYEAFIGRSSWEEFTAPGKLVTERITDGLFGLFHEASVLANKQFILGAMTQKEYDAETMTDERLSLLKLEMGRYRVVPGTKSLVGSTSAGAAMIQYKSWAVPIIRTLTKDAATIVKDLASKPPGEALTTREAREIYRFIGLTTTALIVGATAAAEDDDESFTGQVLKKVYRESMTLMQGIDPSLWLATPRLMGFVTQLGKNLKATITLEEYKSKPGLKGIDGLQRQLIPRALKQFDTEEVQER